MPIPTTIADLSTTAALNSPAGSDNLSTADDYLRAVQGIVKTVYTDASARSETLTNKTVNLTSNTLSGTTAQFNTALSDGDFATLAGSETLTNKALNGTLGATTPSTVVATTGTFKNASMTNPVTLTGNSVNTTYGMLTFNNVDTNTGAIGIWGGADNDLRFNVPTAGSHIFRVNNVTQAVIDASGNVGVGVTPAGTGGCLQLKSGITFPATQSASTDANTLDDYEEGTWTPSPISLTVVGTPTYSGTYTKIGNYVFITAVISSTTSTAAVADTTRFSGLPFAASSVSGMGSSIITATTTGTAGGLVTGSTYVTGGWAASTNVRFTAWYQV